MTWILIVLTMTGNSSNYFPNHVDIRYENIYFPTEEECKKRGEWYKGLNLMINNTHPVEIEYFCKPRKRGE